MLPVSDLNKILLDTEGFLELLRGERLSLILRTIFDASVFLFPLNNKDLIFPKKKYFNTMQTTIIGLDYTILKSKKKILTLSPYDQSCAL